MPPMPLEIKAVIVAVIVLLVGLIVLYHVWMERRRGAAQTVPEPRPPRLEPVQTASASPPAAAGPARPAAAGPAPPTAAGPVRPPAARPVSPAPPGTRRAASRKPR